MDQTQIIKEKCTGCGTCAEVCAAFIIEMQNGRPSVVRPDYCLNCGHCSSVCPSDAVIQVNKDSEKYNPELMRYHLFDCLRIIFRWQLEGQGRTPLF